MNHPIGTIKQAAPLFYLGALLAAWIVARILFVMSTTTSDINYIVPDISKTPYIIASTDRKGVKKADIQKAGTAKVAKSDSQKRHISQVSVELKMQRALERNAFANWGSTSFTPNPLSPQTRAAGGAFPSDALFPYMWIAGLTERASSYARKDVANIYGSAEKGIAAVSVDDYGSFGNKTPISNARSLEPQSNAKFNGYAYIFGRAGGGGANSLGARYGASQAALQASYRIHSADLFILDASLRAQTALGQNDREIAVGVRLKPNEKFPIAIIAERRVRPSADDGFAIYAAGGKSALKLPKDFNLDLYGQAGVSTAGKDTLFFDASANVQRPLYKNGKVAVSAGGGAWAGGQRGAQRLDVGPTVSVNISNGKQNFRISGDWREQVTGNAEPGSGAAITISSDF